MNRLANGWSRHEWTTKDADPTMSVRWTYVDPDAKDPTRSHSDITEFQTVYRGTGIFRGLPQEVLKQLHDQQEDAWARARGEHCSRKEDHQPPIRGLFTIEIETDEPIQLKRAFDFLHEHYSTNEYRIASHDGTRVVGTWNSEVMDL